MIWVRGSTSCYRNQELSEFSAKCLELFIILSLAIYNEISMSYFKEDKSTVNILNLNIVPHFRFFTTFDLFFLIKCFVQRKMLISTRVDLVFTAFFSYE